MSESIQQPVGVLGALWQAVGLPSQALPFARLIGAEPVLPSSFAVGGADVLLVNSPQLPNIAAMADTSRGKLSAHVDLRAAGDPPRWPPQ